MWRPTLGLFALSKMNRCGGFLSWLTFSGSSASYHSSTFILSPRDSGFKASVRVRRSPITSSGQLVSPAKKKPRPDTRSGIGISSELYNLSLEDFRKSKPDLQKGSEKAKDRSIPSQRRAGGQDELVFGVAPCLLALSQGRRKPTRLFVKRVEGRQRESVEKVCEEALRRGVPIQHITKREMDKMTNGAVHQGLCLQASPLSFVTHDKASNRQKTPDCSPPLWLVLDGVQDPMNLGAILRSAYFLGVDRVASSIRNSCALTPVVSKASSGVLELMDVYGYDNLAAMVKMKIKHGWQAVGTIGSEASASGATVLPCSDFKMSKSTLLLMGGEGSGLSTELRDLCDSFLIIPPNRDLHPAVDSLNVSVATGILLHSLLSSWRTA